MMPLIHLHALNDVKRLLASMFIFTLPTSGKSMNLQYKPVIYVSLSTSD